jgi:hypothetical protein
MMTPEVPKSGVLKPSSTVANHSSDDQTFMKEFQTRIMGQLFSQNKMMIDMKAKNDELQDTLAGLVEEIGSLKTIIKSNPSAIEKPSTSLQSSNPFLAQHGVCNTNDTATADSLTSFLYGANTEFKYQLVLQNELSLPLYRERNFKFTACLIDMNGNVVENFNRVPLSISLYSSENPPKYIDSNTAGNKILKGFTEKDLINGQAQFDKIQIKEVTSHFRNGWVFIMVHPKISAMNNSCRNVILNGSGTTINPQDIKPLILEKIIVKAKKTKEVGGCDDGDKEE